MIPLGYRLTNEIQQIGFRVPGASTPSEELLFDAGEASLITIAPTGAGKGRCNIIPTCLHYRGAMIIIDPKGEAARVTAEVRRGFGQVYIIDPFKTVTDTPDSFNPLDIAFDHQPPDQQGIMLAKAMQGDNTTFQSDPYWDNCANALISGLLIHELTQNRSFVNFRKNIHQDDMEYKLAVLLDSKTVTNPLAYELIANFLNIPSDKTRPCVLSTARQHLSILGDQAVMDSLGGKTSFSINDLLEGKPMTIYLVLPPNKLSAYHGLLRIWITAFLFLLTERRTQPPIPTLLLLDECANLGRLQPLVSAITMMRSFGLRIWCFFQDAAQLKQLYPGEWQTLINNCDVVMAFGIRTYLMAKELETIAGGMSADKLMDLQESHGFLMRAGKKPAVIRLCDYLEDRFFQQYSYARNPMYSNKRSIHGDIGL